MQNLYVLINNYQENQKFLHLLLPHLKKFVILKIKIYLITQSKQLKD